MTSLTHSLTVLYTKCGVWYTNARKGIVVNLRATEALNNFAHHGTVLLSFSRRVRRVRVPLAPSIS